MHEPGNTPLASCGPSSEADLPDLLHNRQFSAPDATGEKAAVLVGDKSPGKVTAEPVLPQLLNLARPTSGQCISDRG